MTRFLDGSGKYLNSGKSLSYVLFGEDGPADHYYLAEGVFDAMALQSEGKKAVCAVQGVNLTKHQVARLARLSNYIIIRYDDDEAGRRAAVRTAKMLERIGLRVDVEWPPYAT